MKHLGDITKINGAEVEPVWAIIGGSPCQDLSVAGFGFGFGSGFGFGFGQLWLQYSWPQAIHPALHSFWLTKAVSFRHLYLRY